MYFMCFMYFMYFMFSCISLMLFIYFILYILFISFISCILFIFFSSSILFILFIAFISLNSFISFREREIDWWFPVRRADGFLEAWRGLKSGNVFYPSAKPAFRGKCFRPLWVYFLDFLSILLYTPREMFFISSNVFFLAGGRTKSWSDRKSI